MEKTPEQSYIDFPNAPKGLKGVSDGTDTQVEDWMINKWKTKIVQKELYKKRDLPWKGDRKIKEGNTVAIKNQTYNHTCEEYIRIDLLRPVLRTVFLNLIQSVSLSLWTESTLFVIQLILTQFFQLTLYKFIVLDFLGLSPFILGRVSNLVFIVNYLSIKLWIYLKDYNYNYLNIFPFLR